MKTKKKLVIKKVVKKTNWKALGILVAIIIGITGYVLYKNSAATPEIFAVKNPIKGNGLEAEEAAYIKKTTVKEGLGTASGPVVKVTVEKDGVEYSSNVSLKKTEKDDENTNDDNESGNNNVKDLAAQITNQVLTDNGQAAIVYDAGKPVAEPAAPAAGQSGTSATTLGTGTCSTAGSPVLEGTWVSTGRVFDDKNPATDDSAQRECVKCGGAGKYEGSMSCSSAFQQGLPMVLPTGGGRPYTGTDISVKPCYVKSGGSFVQVGAGYSADNAVCTPDGNMTASGKAQEAMDKYCSDIKSGQVFKDGKCQDNSAQIAKEAAEKAAADKKKADEEKKERTANCVTNGFTTWNPDTRNCENKVEKKVDLSGAANITDCKAKIGNSTTLECVPVGYGAYKIVTKAVSSTSKFACASGAGGTIISIEKQQNGVSVYRQCDKSGCGSDGTCSGVTLGPVNPLLPPSTSGVVSPEKDPKVLARLEEMKAKMNAAGPCKETVVDIGIKIICDTFTKEPKIVFCDGGKGKYDSNGKCISAAASATTLSPSNTAFDSSSNLRPGFTQDGGQRVSKESDCPDGRGGTKVGGIVLCNNSNGTPFDTQKALAEAAQAERASNAAQGNSTTIDCPTGSTLRGSTCVKDDVSLTIKDGEECRSQAKCKEVCDGEYSKASVKKPNDLFSWSHYYCGDEEAVNSKLGETGYLYTIKDTFVVGSSSTSTNNGSNSTADSSSSVRVPIQKEDGLVSQQAADPGDCKYEPTIKSSWNGNWECPSEWSAIQTTNGSQATNSDSSRDFFTPSIDLDKEKSRVTDESQCDSGKTNKFVVNNETLYYCMNEDLRYVNPDTNKQISGSICESDDVCESGECVKRYAIWSDWLANDRCQ